MRLLLISFCFLALTLAGCVEQQSPLNQTATEASSHEDPFGDSPALRVIHLAPSLDTLDVQLDRPAYDGGDQLVRLLEDEEPLTFTARSDRYHAAASGGSLALLDPSGDRVVDANLDLESGKAYLAMALESSGLPGLEVREIQTAPRPDAEGNITGLDGNARVFVFHGSEGLGRISVVLDGPEQLVWGDLSFGDDSFMDAQVAPPGEYTLALLDSSSEAVEGILTPPTVTLQADTWVYLFLSAPGPDGGIPQVVFAVDGPALPRHIEDVPLPMMEE